MTLMSKACVMTGPGEVVIREYPVLEPAETGAVIKVELAGICGTDLHLYKGQVPGSAPYPLIPGHETVGIIEKMGKGLKKDFLGQPVKEGDRIYIAPSKPCFNCYTCLIAEAPTRCKNKLSYGFTKDPDKEPYLTGGFSEYMQVYRSDSVFFKTEVSAKSIVILEPYAVAMHALDKAQINPGEIVAIQGSGAIGLLALIGAKKAGAAKIIVIGAPQGRLDLAKELGADVTISIEEVPDPQERIELLRKETPYGLGTDVVLECAGVPAAVAEGLDYLREGGRFVEAGNFTDNGDVKINPFRHMVSKNCTIYGTWGSYPKHFVRCLRLIEKEPELYEKLVSHMVPLDRVEEALKAMSGHYNLDGKDVLKAVVAP